MPFTPEDGTGLNNSNSYMTVEEFILHWVDRGVDYTDKEVEDIMAALINATDYVELRWSNRFAGRKKKDDQALSWPRVGVYDRNSVELTGVPDRLKKAIAEYAKRSLVSDLAPDPDVDPNIKQISETMGPLSTTRIYSGGPAVEKWRAYPKADAWLKELCIHGRGSFR